MRISLTNDFHNTTVDLNCDVRNTDDPTNGRKIATAFPSRRQIKRAKQELCGSRDCTCSNEAGTRGPQQLSDGTRLVIDFSPIY